MIPIINYGVNRDAWSGFRRKLEEEILNKGAIAVCDIGGGRKPFLKYEHLERFKLDYTVLDISQTELDMASAAYKKQCADIASDAFSPEQEFDLVFSQMLAEHVKDGRQFHKNVYKMLKPGGIALHFFPTLYSLPFIINYISPGHLSRLVLNNFRPIQYNRGKFRAYYSYCRGPLKSQMIFFTSLGYEIEEYKGFFGHGYYNKIPLVKQLHQKWYNWLVKHPRPILTSFAWVVLRKPYHS